MGEEEEEEEAALPVGCYVMNNLMWVVDGNDQRSAALCCSVAFESSQVEAAFGLVLGGGSLGLVWQVNQLLFKPIWRLVGGYRFLIVTAKVLRSLFDELVSS